MTCSAANLLEQMHKINSKALNSLSHIMVGYKADEFKTLESILSWNALIVKFALAQSKYSVSWHEELIHFCYQEFIKRHDTPYGFFGLNKKDLLRHYSEIGHPDYQQIFDDGLEPVIRLFKHYEETQSYFRDKLRKPVLIITALPLEFRSIVRRLSMILDVDKIPYTPGERAMEINVNQDAFEFIFNKENDSYRNVSALDDNPFDRPFFLLVDGVFFSNEHYARCQILLLPNYGPHKSADAMEMYDRKGPFGFNYSEVIISGIAGGLLPSNEMNLGDLIVSKDIYGSETKRGLENLGEGQDKLHDIEIVGPRRFQYDEIDFNYSSWCPNLIESIPIPDKEFLKNYNSAHIGFNKVISADVVSLDTVVKAEWYRDKLLTTFPSCQAVEMEAFGIARYLVKENKTQNVRIIKSICDYADYRKNYLFQPYCADIASSFVQDYVLHKFGKILT
jgi:nucleoside phosphorylase